MPEQIEISVPKKPSEIVRNLINEGFANGETFSNKLTISLLDLQNLMRKCKEFEDAQEIPVERAKLVESGSTALEILLSNISKTNKKKKEIASSILVLRNLLRKIKNIPLTGKTRSSLRDILKGFLNNKAELTREAIYAADNSSQNFARTAKDLTEKGRAGAGWSSAIIETFQKTAELQAYSDIIPVIKYFIDED